MKNRKAAALFFALMLSGSAVVFAGDPVTATDYLRDIGIKFGRGVGNILQSPAEIPCTMAYSNRESPGTGLVTGLGKGIWRMVYRLWVGVDEVGTFIIPMEPTLPVVCKDPQKHPMGVS